MDGPWFYLAFAAFGIGIGLILFSGPGQTKKAQRKLNIVGAVSMLSGIGGIALLVF